MLGDDISKFVICITFSDDPAQLNECRDIPRSMITNLGPYQYKRIKPRFMFIIVSSGVNEIMFCMHHIFCYTVGVGIHKKIRLSFWNGCLQQLGHLSAMHLCRPCDLLQCSVLYPTYFRFARLHYNSGRWSEQHDLVRTGSTHLLND